MDKLRKSTIHRIIKSLSPKREANGGRCGLRLIPRSISPDAVECLTEYLNEHMGELVGACEAALDEINTNPNSYYKQHRYDLQVVKAAIEKLDKRDNV
jgi:histone H3/H4